MSMTPDQWKRLLDMARMYNLLYTQGSYYPRHGFPIPSREYCLFALQRARKLALENGSTVTF